MKIELTNAQIKGIVEYINGDNYCLSKEALAKKGLTPGTALSWKLLKTRKALTSVYELLEQAKGEIESRYSGDDKSEEITEDDGTIKRNVKAEFKDEFIKEMTELMSQTNDIEITKLSIEDLLKYDLTELDLLNIEFMIEDEAVEVEVIE